MPIGMTNKRRSSTASLSPFGILSKILCVSLPWVFTHVFNSFSFALRDIQKYGFEILTSKMVVSNGSVRDVIIEFGFGRAADKHRYEPARNNYFHSHISFSLRAFEMASVWECTCSFS